MRRTRILLLFVLTVAVTVAIAGASATTAGALTFTDAPCYPQTVNNVLLKVCPDGETGKTYSVKLQAPAGSGCWPNDKIFLMPGSALPPGLTLTSDGLISGIPTTAGTYTFWVEMKDIYGAGGWCYVVHDTERQFSITVKQGLQIVQRQSALAPGTTNTPYNLQFSANGGGTQTWSVSSGALPDGLTLNPQTGMLSGTPTKTGDFHFQVKVSDGSRSDVETYTMSVVEALKLAGSAAAGEIGRPYSLALSATGGRGPYTWAATGLPAGLSIDAASGAISGSPTAAGLATVQVTVTDTIGLKQTLNLSVRIAAHLAFLNRALAHGKAGAAYHGRFATVGGVAPRAFRMLGRLPAHLRLDARTGALRGTPKKAGTYRLKVRVRDALGVIATKTFVLKVS